MKEDNSNQSWGKLLAEDNIAKDNVLHGYFPQFRSNLVAGIDEAGRGAFAGPVVAAAVILPEKCEIVGLADSKALSETQRSGLSAQIGMQAVAWGIGLSWQREIDDINILQATFKAMARALAAMKFSTSACLVDGNHKIPKSYLDLYNINKEMMQQSVVDGDAYVPVISAASILAKTFRDELMTKLDRMYPQYGFEKHKGYGTQLHRDKLKEFGPCRFHRLSFKGISEQNKQSQGSLC